jgi:hypothetical protein
MKTKEEILAERKAKHPECQTCQSDELFQPNHDASPRCESGKRNHCTCDVCW